MTGQTMTAAYVTGRGPADTIQVGPLPRPHPGPVEVLVRTEALAVNHVDTFVRSGAYRTPLPMPFIIGRDLVGTVVEPGSATNFRPGERVWCNSLGYAGRQGSFAEYVAVPAERLYRLPAQVDPVQAVVCLHPAATAFLGLFRTAGLRLGETVLVLGGAGGVGSAVIQLAAQTGARVLATARPENFAWCRELGAEAVFDYRDPDVADRIGAAVPAGVDVLWDNSGRNDFPALLPLLAQGGRMVVLAGLRAAPSLPVGQLYTRDASVRGFAISNASVAELAKAARAINFTLGRGRLRVRLARTLPLREAAAAHRLQEAGRLGGRLAVVP